MDVFPTPTRFDAQHRSRRHYFVLIGTLVGLFAAGLSYAHVRFGSLTNAIAFTCGTRIVVDGPPLLSTKSNDIVASFQLRNLAFNSIRVVGAKSSCACTVVENMPVEISPARVGVITARISRSKTAPATGAIELFTDEPMARVVILKYDTTEVVGNPPSTRMQTERAANSSSSL